MTSLVAMMVFIAWGLILGVFAANVRVDRLAARVKRLEERNDR